MSITIRIAAFVLGTILWRVYRAYTGSTYEIEFDKCYWELTSVLTWWFIFSNIGPVQKWMTKKVYNQEPAAPVDN